MIMEGDVFATAILVGILAALVCVWLAKTQGRDKSEFWGVVPFLLGFFFGIFAVLGYLIAGKTLEKKVEEAKAIQRLIDDE